MPYGGSNAIALFPTHLQNHQPSTINQLTSKPPNLPTSQPPNLPTSQPWPIGHATRTTFNLQPPNLPTSQPPNLPTSQPWPIGHATRTTFNLQTFNLPTLAYWPRYANNLQPNNLQTSR
ncbi:MAG: hypothetical protein F6K53_31515 [Moorea sp. SIO4A1]|uniref:hypothetical protein n=1 Tax=Moorena sp. SIO4A1 TaxID=2607835 RepID=UPI00144F4668|nr:hypothetical protein [Moorena sp. SIO4A1]NEQ61716.1 hypothetical protein [Moorena sp. SIO4A1]